MQIEVGARSDVGVVRRNNEDCFAVDLPLHLLVLCDGMGGQAAGEVASKLGVDILMEHCRQATKNPRLPLVGENEEKFSPQTNRLGSGIRMANQAIREAAESSPSKTGMGSTVVAAWIRGNILGIAHVGDSRIYLFRDGALQQLTQDHSLVMEQVRKGLMSLEQAEHSEMSNVIVRALGADAAVMVDLDEMWVKEGDQILLCSDGLIRMVPDEGIAQVLAEAESAQRASDRLVEIANDNGGEDNVTVIVGRLKASSRWGGLGKLARNLFGGNRHG